MRRFSLGVAVAAVMALCLGNSSTIMAAGAERVELVDTAEGGTAGGNAVVVPTKDGTQVIVVGHGLAEDTLHYVSISGEDSDGFRFFLFHSSSTTNGAGVLTLHGSVNVQVSIARVDVAVVSANQSDPALFGSR